MRIALITVGSRFSCMAKPLPGSNLRPPWQPRCL